MRPIEIQLGNWVHNKMTAKKTPQIKSELSYQLWIVWMSTRAMHGQWIIISYDIRCYRFIDSYESLHAVAHIHYADICKSVSHTESVATMTFFLSITHMHAADGMRTGALHSPNKWRRLNLGGTFRSICMQFVYIAMATQIERLIWTHTQTIDRR